MAESFSPVAGGDRHRRSRSPSAATSRSSSARCCCRGTRPRTAESEADYLRRLAGEGLREPLRRPGAGGGAGAARDGARGDREDGLRGLLPDRLGLRQVREGQRDRGRSGPRLGGRLDRLLRAAHHRRRPAALRPAVRALPQRRARLDAGHRHRLLGQGARPRDPLRGRQVRPGVGRPDRHLRPHVPARRDARRGAGARASTTATGDRLAKLIPEPIMGRSQSFDECLAEEPELRARLRDGRRGAPDHRRRPRARGHRPQRLDPRRGGGHRRPAADRHRAPAAGRGPRRRGEDGGRTLQDRHPVLDGPDRGDRPAQDGLPRAAQPRRDRGGAGHHRALDRRAARHGHAAARRPEDLRDARARRLGRRVPVRVRRHARGAAQGPAHGVRGPRGAGRPLPPRRHAPHRHLRAQQAQPGGDPLPRRAPAPDHRADLLGDPLPGAVDADRQGDRRLLGPRGRRPAQGDRQEGPRQDGGPRGPLLRGRARHRHRRAA